MHILLCEDNKKTFLHIEQLINDGFTNEEEKCLLHIAETGNQAIYLADQFSVDVFIIDLELPDMNGLEVAIKLRKKYKYQPIIIESACKNLKTKERIQDKINYYAFLSKPFKNSQFLNHLENAIELSKCLKNQEVCIKMNNSILKYDVRDIICIRKINSSKKVEIYTYEGKLHKDIVYSSIRKLKETILPLNSMIQVNKSYLINPLYISKIDYKNSDVSLKHFNYSIPISVKYNEILLSLI